jgi:histidine triad (HIT) family protein
MAEPERSDSGCVFCEIVAGRSPSYSLYRHDTCTVFLDIQPINPGHMLIVPNIHAAHLADLDQDTGAHLFRMAQRLAQALRRSGVHCEGVNLLLADGEAAGQEVFHTHLHVLPRYLGDEFGFRFGPNYEAKPARADLEQVAKQVRQAL